MEEEKVVRQDDHLLEPVSRNERLPPDQRRNIVDIVMGEARYWVIDDDDAITLELPTSCVQLAIADLKEVEKRDQRFLALT